uniref:RWD domain-containing protein n=1 Tax=Periophthalmus magnuspinnatus TaxID=409849 RepID=A0A3B4BBD8_9GOBI
MADSNQGNGQDLQIDEVEALSSIYGDEWCVIDEASRIFCIKISDDIEQPKLTACLQVERLSLFAFQIQSCGSRAAWLRGPERAKLANSLEDLYVQHAGDSILYLWVENVREFLVEKSQRGETGTFFVKLIQAVTLFSIVKVLTKDENRTQNYDEIPPIKHGNATTDRRSTFQPHLAPVVTPRQVKMVLEKLYENKKISSATHNIYAYRIYCEDKNSFLQDCEDDGETAAGGRLLHLLQILDVRNVMVVVSRWYGGILLGPDRFKHINNCARSILQEEGYIVIRVIEKNKQMRILPTVKQN